MTWVNLNSIHSVSEKVRHGRPQTAGLYVHDIGEGRRSQCGRWGLTTKGQEGTLWGMDMF